jgi:hypothetical protein
MVVVIEDEMLESVEGLTKVVDTGRLVVVVFILLIE